MSAGLFLFVGLGTVAAISIVTVALQHWAYQEGFREGYRKASYDAAKIQTDIDGKASLPPSIR